MKRAFTLVELLVSLALVLVLILGVNAIFKMASDTVNGGLALGAAARDDRAVQGVIFDDFRTAVLTNGPMLLIRSERVPAFRNRADELADRDGLPLTTDLNNNNSETDAGEVTLPLVYNSRNHRIDRVSFFATGLFRRQTGTESATSMRYLDDGSSNEAYVWYGHVDQPNGRPSTAIPGRLAHKSPGEVPNPPDDPNPDNYYATDWILGRSVTLLRDMSMTPLPHPTYIAQASTPAANLTPLQFNSRASQPAAGNVRDWLVTSRYDLADTTVAKFRDKLAANIRLRGSNIAGTTWYETLGGQWSTGAGAQEVNARVQASPYPDRPLTPYGVARTAPVFVRGCTQFIVEYAGDYLRQNPDDGTIQGTYLAGAGGTDGEVDYVMVTDRPHPAAPVKKVRRVRWYGMPRNVDTLDDGAGVMIRGGQGAANPNLMRDVVPLRDVLMAGGVSASQLDDAGFFEHFDGLDPQQNYATAAVEGNPKLLRYYAAWGPRDLAAGSLSRPRMLRVTMTFDDPDGRMAEGQTHEYVVDLP